MRELQYIQDILVDIYKQNLQVTFICDNRINKHDLEAFYFTRKVFKAIIAFAEKMDLSPKVLFNNQEWQLFNDILRQF